MTPVRTAVILAAGCGRRLGALGQQRPKGLIEVDGQRLMDRSVAQLRKAGIERIVLVVGHQEQQYVQAFQDFADVEIHSTQRYADTGSMYSLYSVRESVMDDFLLLESDLLYESRSLPTLLRHDCENALLTSGWTGAGDEVWVDSLHGHLRALSKNHSSLSAVCGELVGITRVSMRLFAQMCEIAEQQFVASLYLDYEVVVAMAAQTIPVCCPQVWDLAWTEIDDIGQWQRATGVVVPMLKARADWW